MSKKIRLSAKARADLIAIGRYTEKEWGREQRNHYLKQLDDAFNLIADHPEIGKDRSFVLPGYRCFLQGSHVIYYKNDRTIEIIRVLHKQMDIEMHLRQ